MPLAFSILKRKFSTTNTMNLIKSVTVIGGGIMGSGIAQVAAQAGNNVTLVDVSPESLQRAEATITTSLGRIAKKLYKDKPSAGEKFIKATKARIKSTTDTFAAVKHSELIIEAIVENIDAKKELFKTLDDVAPKHTIFTSNTSSLSIGEMASVTIRKDRFGGLHFFNPVVMMKLLEVVRIPPQSEKTYHSLMEWGKSIGKTCITCRDIPGFVVNRLMVPYIAEAIRMLERGEATARDIDTAMKLGAGYPMGPIELADYGGLDTSNFILEGWHEKNPENPLFKPTETVKKLVAEGKLGVKTGEGFYNYKK